MKTLSRMWMVALAVCLAAGGATTIACSDSSTGGSGGSGTGGSGGSGGTGGTGGTGGAMGKDFNLVASLHPLAGGGALPTGTSVELWSAVSLLSGTGNALGTTTVGADGKVAFTNIDTTKIAIGGVVKITGTGLSTTYQGVCSATGTPACSAGIAANDPTPIFGVPEALNVKLETATGAQLFSTGYVLGQALDTSGAAPAPIGGATIEGATAADHLWYLAPDGSGGFTAIASTEAGAMTDPNTGAYVATLETNMTRQFDAKKDGADVDPDGPQTTATLANSVFLQFFKIPKAP